MIKWEEFVSVRTIRQLSGLCIVRDGQVRFEVEYEHAIPVANQCFQLEQHSESICQRTRARGGTKTNLLFIVTADVVRSNRMITDICNKLR